MLLEIVNFSAKTLTRTGNGLFIRHKKRQKTHIKQAAFDVLYILTKILLSFHLCWCDAQWNEI